MTGRERSTEEFRQRDLISGESTARWRLVGSLLSTRRRTFNRGKWCLSRQSRPMNLNSHSDFSTIVTVLSIHSCKFLCLIHTVFSVHLLIHSITGSGDLYCALIDSVRLWRHSEDLQKELKRLECLRLKTIVKIGSEDERREAK